MYFLKTRSHLLSAAVVGIGLMMASTATADASASSETIDPQLRARLFSQIPSAEASPSEGKAAESWRSAFSPGTSTIFDADGLRVSGSNESESWQLGLRLDAYGRREAMTATPSGILRSSNVRAELDHGRARQWVVGSDGRLTHGLTLDQPPYLEIDGKPEAGSGELIFELELSGTFTAELSRDRQNVELRDGERLLTYGGVSAVDASGRHLPSRIELKEPGIILRVDDTGADYPVRLSGFLTEVKKLVQPLALAKEHAGWSVEIDDDTAVVGAPFAAVGILAGAGKVYLFERNFGGPENWGLLKVLTASDPEVGASFGWDVAIHGDMIAVGSHTKNGDLIFPNDRLITDSGSVYLFERNSGGADNWGQTREVLNPTPAVFDNFGWSVTVHGDVLAVGTWLAEPESAPLTLENGEVMIYHRDRGGPSHWGHVTTLTTTAPTPWANFGHDVAVDGDTLVVGTPYASLALTNEGEAYVFDRNQGGTDAWGPVTVLRASDGALTDRFGDNVAIHQDTIVVGADFADGAGVDSGKAYVFERNMGGTNAWGQAGLLTASDQEPGDYYGWAVGVENDLVVVGAHGDSSPTFAQGSAYLYQRQAGGWTQVEKFTAGDGDVLDDFGIAVDLSGGTVLVGARLDDQVGMDSGAAYIFQLAASADLKVSVTSTPNPVAAGGSVTYTVTVENLGDDDATGVTVSHLFSPDAGTGSTTSGCNEDPAGAATCTLGTLASGASVQYTLTRPVGAGASGSLSFTATLAAATQDPSSANNEFTDVVVVGGGGGGSADLLLLKQDSADPAVPGSELTYTLVVLNNGPGQAMNVKVTEMLPMGVSGAFTTGCSEDPSGTPSCSLGNILPGTSKSYTVKVNVDAAAGQTLSNFAVVSSDTGDSNAANNQAGETTAVGAGTADLHIFMDDDVDPIAAGDLLTYTVDVLNNGPDSAADVVVTNTLPASVTFVETMGCAEDPAGEVTCSLGEIAPGSSKQFSISVQTDVAVLEPLVASSSVTSSATDPIEGNNATSEATTVEAAGDVDLFLFLTDSADPVDAGGDLSYTFIIGNRGPSTAQGVELITEQPDGLINATTIGCDEGDGGSPVCTVGSIEPGMTRVVMLSGELVGTLGGTLTLPASVRSANPEVAADDNEASETTTVIGAPGMADLIISIEEAADPVMAGETVTYEVTIINLGPHQAQDVMIDVTPPAGLGAVETTGCLTNPGWPSCSLGAVDPGVPITVELTADVELTAANLLTIMMSVSSSTEDANPGNNSNSETTTIESVGLANLKVSFSEAPDTASAGNLAAFSVTVENMGPDAAEGVTVAGTVTGPIAAYTSLAGVTTMGCDEDPDGLALCTLGSIAVGASSTYSFEIPVANPAEGMLEVMVVAASAFDDTDMANNTASHQTMIDGQPPTVTLLHSVGDTGGGSLDACEEAQVDITQLLVTFSEAMNDPADHMEASDVTNPDVYRLVASGPDKSIGTEGCTGLHDDDELVSIESVSYDAATWLATLDLAAPLADGPYRLMVCDAVTDEAGNQLDGDDDATAGVDFRRYFRVDTQNLFTEGHFDCNLDAWERLATAETEITYTAFDVDGAQISGASVMYNNLSTTDFSIMQCVPVEREGNYRITGSLWLRDLESDLTVSKVCEFFSEPGCGGTSAGMEFDSETFSAPSADWATFTPWNAPAPTGTMSALCALDLELADANAEMTVMVDDLVMTDKVLLDGFETGDTSKWSETNNE